MQPAEMLQGRTRETEIRRDAAGRWFNGEDRIDHPNVSKSFDGWIDRADDGRFVLSNDINWAYVAIDGPAYFVKDVAIDDNAVELILSGERRERLVPESLHEDEQGALWCIVRGGRCPARFGNHAATKLVNLIGEDERGMHLVLNGKRYYPSTVQEPTELGAQAARTQPMESRE